MMSRHQTPSAQELESARRRLLADRLKDLAHELNLTVLRGTYRTGQDAWTTIEVSHASIFSEAQDGWDVTVREGSL